MSLPQNLFVSLLQCSMFAQPQGPFFDSLD